MKVLLLTFEENEEDTLTRILSCIGNRTEILEYEDKGQALQQAEQRCGVEVNRQNLCNGSFVVDTVESVVNWFMAGNSYKECVFSAINSGKSSDAVGALTGLLAGIYYGLELKNGVKGFETMESYIDSFIQYLNHPTL